MKKIGFYTFVVATIGLLTMTLFDTAQLRSFTSLGKHLMLMGKVSPKEAKFKDFVGNFPQEQLPYSLNSGKLESYLNASAEKLPDSKIIDESYQEFFEESLNEDNSFSRIPSQATTYYIAKLKETPNRTTVVYARTIKYGSKKIGNITFYVANYNNKGKLLNNLVIANTSSYSQQTAIVDKDLNIHTKEISMYDNKRVVGEIHSFKVDEKGLFVKDTQPTSTEGKVSTKE